MRFTLTLLTDVALILLATLAAAVLRDNLEVSSVRFTGLIPYILCTVFASIALLLAFGVNRAIWRFTTLPDYLRISIAVTSIVVCTVLLTFAFNRLEGIPRSLPFLQFNVAMIFLVGIRVLYRLNHNARRLRKQKFAPLKVAEEPAVETILLVGLSPLTEAYLQSLVELAPQSIRVAGILGQRDRHVGRLVASNKVLGVPDDLGLVLDELSVAGVTIDRIVVTASFASLSRRSRDEIAAAQRRRAIRVQYLSEDLGFESLPPESRPVFEPRDGKAPQVQVKFEIEPDELTTMQQRPYWKVKRAIDIAASLVLLLISGPLLVVLGIAVAASMGWPLFFRQERPGLGARPFWLFKFRTLGPAHAADGRKLSDGERATRVGNFLRRTRLDELPQLFSILRGDMSFIGPRPLLSVEQNEAHRARLLVRPGLSGWAQVVGGRAISVEDKAALDVWYVRNASLFLDAAIVFRTIPMVFFGERISEGLIERAWRDLRKAGVLKEQLAELHQARSPLTA